MQRTKVYVRDVTLDLTPSATRIQRYRITLTCGCSWWENHAAPPPSGQDAWCYASHTRQVVLIQGSRVTARLGKEKGTVANELTA